MSVRTVLLSFWWQPQLFPRKLRSFHPQADFIVYFINLDDDSLDHVSHCKHALDVFDSFFTDLGDVAHSSEQLLSDKKINENAKRFDPIYQPLHDFVERQEVQASFFFAIILGLLLIWFCFFATSLFFVFNFIQICFPFHLSDPFFVNHLKSFLDCLLPQQQINQLFFSSTFFVAKSHFFFVKHNSPCINSKLASIQFFVNLQVFLNVLQSHFACFFVLLLLQLSGGFLNCKGLHFFCCSSNIFEKMLLLGVSHVRKLYFLLWFLLLFLFCRRD
mmetsp:Transcript_5012/g.9677  ORF Transcript_5012/g.9677 Transcript_5012/m.9677 type:complete len:274 (-) Transcript_5012:149-970(-)